MKRPVTDFAGIALVFALLPWAALAFDSGSTGVGGDFNPTVSTEVVLPPSGILNYRSVTIPTGVTVTFKRNAANTPVVMLVQGNATIAGRIDVSGSDGAPTGSAAGGSLTAEGIEGRGGPGGFDGGRGARPGPVAGPAGSTLGATGGNGLGPGGGGGGVSGIPVDLNLARFTDSPAVGGGGFTVAGGGGQMGVRVSMGAPGHDGYYGEIASIAVEGGRPYGNDALLPLIGGSGGGGGASGAIFHGAGGGGGGGAILVAVSGTLDFTGSILANGGQGGKVRNVWDTIDVNGCGGGGSGGAVRLMATTLAGNGLISVNGGKSPPFPFCAGTGGSASAGRSRMEAEYTSRPVVGLPSAVFPTGEPSLKFVSVGSIPVPASPSGSDDVIVPTATPNPVAITLATSGVPVGSIVKVSVIPRFAPITLVSSGPPPTPWTIYPATKHTTTSISVDSPPTVGSLDNATTSVSLDIPPGHSALSAQTTFMVLAAVGDALSRFAQGERVEKITLTSTVGQSSKATLHTVTGRQFEVEPALLQLAALSQ